MLKRTITPQTDNKRVAFSILYTLRSLSDDVIEQVHVPGNTTFYLLICENPLQIIKFILKKKIRQVHVLYTNMQTLFNLRFCSSFASGDGATTTSLYM